MRKWINVIGVATALGAGIGVLLLKLAIEEKKEEAARIAWGIRQNQEAIRVLETEWSYLTTPSILHDKSVRFSGDYAAKSRSDAG